MRGMGMATESILTLRYPRQARNWELSRSGWYLDTSEGEFGLNYPRREGFSGGISLPVKHPRRLSLLIGSRTMPPESILCSVEWPLRLLHGAISRGVALYCPRKMIDRQSARNGDFQGRSIYL